MTGGQNPLRRQAAEISRSFRVGLSLAAALELEPFLARWASTLGSAELQAALPVLQSMLDCQARADWIGLADRLEYELWANQSEGSEHSRRSS